MDTTRLITESAIALGAALLIATKSVGVFHPRSRLYAPIISRGPTTTPARVALTFDDGPNSDATPLILDILRRHNVKATFFVIGVHAERRSDLLRRIHDEGHLIGNHTFDHSRLGLFRGPWYWDDQIRRTADVIHRITGQTPTLFRPPMGFKQRLMARAAKHCHQEIVTWTRRARDGWPTEPQAILQRLAQTTRGGDILLLHDGCEPGRSQSRQPTVEALDPLIAALHARALQLVRLNELLQLTDA